MPETAFSAAPQVDPEARIPGAWLTIGAFRHFFREEASQSLCDRAERGPESPHARPICQGCRQDLAEYNAELAKPSPRPRLVPAAPEVDHDAMAEKYREAAAAEPNRFRRIHLLAEARVYEIKAKQWRSAYQGRGVWHG